MNVLHLEKGKFSNLHGLLSGQLHMLYEAEQQLVKGGSVIALAIAFMVLAPGTVYWVEQTKLKSAENHYQSLLQERERVIQSISQDQQSAQSDLIETNQEMDLALGYIKSLKNSLIEVTKERNVALGYNLPPKGTLETNP